MKAHADLNIVDNRSNRWTESVSISIGTMKILHLFKLIGLAIFVVFCWSFPIDISIFRLPLTTCKGNLEFSIAIVISCVFWTFNLADGFIGVGIGEKLLGII